ncbi:MAG: hypothetical protein ACLQFR_11045 [Streptosporangiaceae bacterium]
MVAPAAQRQRVGSGLIACAAHQARRRMQAAARGFRRPPARQRSVIMPS